METLQIAKQSEHELVSSFLIVSFFESQLPYSDWLAVRQVGFFCLFLSCLFVFVSFHALFLQVEHPSLIVWIVSFFF